MSASPPKVPTNTFITPESYRTVNSVDWSALALASGPSRELTEGSHVTKLHFLKGLTDKQHEKLGMDVKLPDVYRKPNTFILTDRRPKKVDTRNREPSAPSPSQSRSPFGSASRPVNHLLNSESSGGLSYASATSSGNVPADDRVIIQGLRYSPHSIDAYIDSVKEEYLVIGTWEFAIPIELSKVAIAIATVTEHADYYDPFAYQCFWYAHMILELIIRLHPGPPLTKNAEFESIRGTFLNIRIRQEDSLEALIKSYDEKWKEFTENGELLRQDEQQKLDQVVREREVAVRKEEREAREISDRAREVAIQKQLKAERREQEAEQARRDAEQARDKAEQARGDEEQARREAERGRMEAERQLQELRNQLANRSV